MSASEAVALALGALLLAPACHKEEAAAAPAPLAVRISPAVRGTIADEADAPGLLQPLPGRDVKLGALVSGRLARVLVAEGDRVAAGQLLALLESTPLRDVRAQGQSQLAAARAAESAAAAKAARTEKAVGAGVAATQELEDARLGLETAQAAVQSAEAALSTASHQLVRSELRAPFAGTVARVFAAAGEPVEAGRPLVEVAGTDALELRALLAPGRAAAVRPGQPAQVFAEGLEAPRPATVIAVAPLVDPASGTLLVRLRVENADGALKGGAPARARIALAVHPAALLVPRAALLAAAPEEVDSPAAARAGASRPGGPRRAAVLVAEEGKARRREVTLGILAEDSAEIASGLGEGAQVIASSNYALPDGTPVRAAAQAAPPPVALEGHLEGEKK